MTSQHEVINDEVFFNSLVECESTQHKNKTANLRKQVDII